MNFVLTIVSVVILLTGIVLSHKEKTREYRNYPSDSRVLSDKEIEKDSGSENSDISKTPTPATTLTPTPESISINTPTPQITKNYSNEFIYPNSKVINIDDGNILLESKDDTDKITNWYQNLIKDKKMNINTFIKNTVNGKIQNKLVGVTTDFKITIDIEKLSGEEITTIKITY